VEFEPRALLGAELAQPQLAPVGQPDQHTRAPVLQRGALVEQLQAAGGHQVDEDRELAVELGDEHLADAPDPLEGAPLESREGRVDRLHGHHAGREGGLDLGTGERRPQSASGDLDLRQLGHHSQ
jgi:hypothetical protein